MGSGPLHPHDPYIGLEGKHVTIVLRNSMAEYSGIVELTTKTFVRLAKDGETCVLRRDEIAVIRTAREDSPQARAVHPHGTTEVGKVPT